MRISQYARSNKATKPNVLERFAYNLNTKCLGNSLLIIFKLHFWLQEAIRRILQLVSVEKIQIQRDDNERIHPAHKIAESSILCWIMCRIYICPWDDIG
jgi:hypothetical protein